MLSSGLLCCTQCSIAYRCRIIGDKCASSPQVQKLLTRCLTHARPLWIKWDFLNETRMRLRLMLSSMSTYTAHTKWFFFNISEITRGSNFKIYNNVAHDSLYLSTGTDVTIYFRSAASRTNLSILDHVRGHDFSITIQPISKRFTVL